jgi:hypothetical protein
MTAERRLAAQLFVLAFCVLGMPRVFTQTAAHALFIQAHGAAAMPWAYAAEALCVPLACAAYIAASRCLSLRTLWLGTLALQAAALAALRAALAADIPGAAGAAIVWFETEFVLSSLVAWGMAHQLLTLRQGKRLFGWVAAGEPVAVMSCGLATPLLLRAMAPADLLWLSAAGAIAGMGLVAHILERHTPPPDDDTAAQAQAAHAGPRYVAMLAGMVAVGQMVYFFVDSAFYLEAGRAYPDAASLAAFLGLYSAAVGAASLVAGALLAPWLLARGGVPASVLVLPAAVLAGALATVCSPADLLLPLVILNKVLDQSLRYTLDKSTFITLLQPLPPGPRVRTQALLEGVVEPLAGGAAALLLLALLASAGTGAWAVTAAVAAWAAVWLLLAHRQGRQYSRMLSGPAATAGLSPEALRERLQSLLDTPDTSTQTGTQARVDACLNLLAKAGGPATDAVRRQYANGGPAARARAVEALELQFAPLLAPSLRQRLFALLESAPEHA